MRTESFYVRFYRTGVIRRVDAVNEEEARKIAIEKFGEPDGVWKIGKLLRCNQDVIPATGIMLK